MFIPTRAMNGFTKVFGSVGLIASAAGPFQPLVNASPPEETLETPVVEEVDLSEGYFVDTLEPGVDEGTFNPGTAGPAPSDTNTFFAGGPPPATPQVSEAP